MAFNFVVKLLSLLPDGSLVKNVLKSWRETDPSNPDYINLACLMHLFLIQSSSKGSYCLQERVKRTEVFLDSPDPSFLPLINI